MTTLLDENTGCHLALGEGFTEGVKDLTKINHSMYRIDLIFGTDDMIVDAYLKNGNIIRLIENNKFVGGKNGK
jgi:leucyl aminopeptidase (aminopeptidase T)